VIKRVAKLPRNWPTADEIAEGLNRIRRADSSFDPARFIKCACTAFERIVTAFAKGDKAELRPWLSGELFQRFVIAIDERVVAKETLEVHIERLDSVDIVEAGLAGRTAQVTLKLVSHQINVMSAMDGSIVDGAPGQPVEKTDYWTFARDTLSTDPNWVLVDERACFSNRKRGLAWAELEGACSNIARRPEERRPASQFEIGDDKAQLSALDQRFTFENFVVGKPNELAHAAARRVAEACANSVHTVPFNPLFLYGGVGLGKTHLMHAVAWHVRRHAYDRKVIYLSAEKFMYQFIRALRFKSTMDFKEQFRSVDLLMIDDVQFISGKDSTQEEFFHTFNALVDQNRQIVISADKSPSDLEGLDERMRSRLGWGLVADLHPTTYELRLAILQSKAEQSGIRIPPNVMEFLAHEITSNVRELEGALNRIIADMQLVGREVTPEIAQELLRDLLESIRRRPRPNGA
jgi:chromosomal replication initiator protein DnaA